MHIGHWPVITCKFLQLEKSACPTPYLWSKGTTKVKNVMRTLYRHWGKVKCTLYWHWGKVKCTLVQALRLCTGRTAHRGSRGIDIPFHDHCTRRGWEVSVTPRPLFTPGKDPVHIVQEAGWAPGPVWTGADNLASTGIWSPDRPARIQSLYRLNYRALTRRNGVAKCTALTLIIATIFVLGKTCVCSKADFW